MGTCVSCEEFINENSELIKCSNCNAELCISCAKKMTKDCPECTEDLSKRKIRDSVYMEFLLQKVYDKYTSDKTDNKNRLDLALYNLCLDEGYPEVFIIELIMKFKRCDFSKADDGYDEVNDVLLSYLNTTEREVKDEMRAKGTRYFPHLQYGKV